MSKPIAAPARKIEAHDYVSPDLVRIQLDAAFPNMIKGNPEPHPWPYLRREIPHHWYVDKQLPHVGFLSRDEAHLLYNNALQFRGKAALEIGCWLGWSACHLAAAGVQLDIVDPVLAKPAFTKAVTGALKASRPPLPATLVPGGSPAKVLELAQQGRRWSLIFIDGNHAAPAPLLDAQTCVPFAAPDAMILFHDLISPEVSQGLDYLQEQGWQTMIYQTMQIMGVAWRGNVQPVSHVPDPVVTWPVVKHLQRHSVGR